MRIHTRRYVAAALAVTIGVSFIMVIAALSSSARDGMLAGVAVPYEGAGVVADDLSGEEAAQLRERAADAGAEAARARLDPQQVNRDGRERRTTRVTSRRSRPPRSCAGRSSSRAASPPPRARRRSTSTPRRATTSASATGSRIGTGTNAVDVEVVALVDSPSTLVYAAFYLTWDDLAPFADGMYVDSVAWAGPGPPTSRPTRSARSRRMRRCGPPMPWRRPRSRPTTRSTCWR